MKKYSGVTLLELLVGLVVAGILLAQAVPSLAELLRRRQVEAAADALVADFRFARSEALKRGHSVTICRSGNGKDCEARAGGWEAGWIVFDDRDGNTEADTGEDVLRQQPPQPGGVTITAAGGTAAKGPRYEFRANGLATGTPGSLTVSLGVAPEDARRVLCVNNLGRLALLPAGREPCAN